MRRSRNARGLTTAALLVSACALALAARAAHGEIIDRVLAVVEGQIVTLSDVAAASRFNLVPQDVSTDPVDATLQRLIDRRLMLAEVERYAPAEPIESEVDARVAAAAAPSGTASAFEAALHGTAMTRDELRRFVRDTLRIEAYVEARFASTLQSSEQDALNYYAAHPAEFTASGVLRPFDEVRDLARTAAGRDRFDASVREWAASLRRRASYVVLYLPKR